MTPYEKPVTHRDEDYLDYIRSLPCVICMNKSIAHHESGLGDSGGMSLKCTDYYAINLCTFCHAERDRVGFSSFWVHAYKNPWDVVIERLVTYSEKKDPSFHAKKAMAQVLIDQIVKNQKEKKCLSS